MSIMLLSTGASAGELPVVGTGDGIDALTAVGKSFTARHPDIAVQVPPSIHSSGGIRAVHYGTHVLGRIARPLSGQERDLGIVATPAFRLPAVFFVHRAAGISGLTTEQVTKIYRGDITNWKEVGGSNLRIRVVRREDVDSTLNVFRASLQGWKDLAILEKSKTATTTQDAVDTVAWVEGAIGFGPFSRELEKRVEVLRLDGRHPTDRAYPSGIDLLLIHREATITPDARLFLDYLGTAEAQDAIVASGAVPLQTVRKPALAAGG